jgi:peptidoglycan/LPS O-acetylase OafA/YrhL
VFRELDKKDTAILKGLAISAIVFHNFFHLVVPVHENEFSFDAGRFPVFLQYLAHPATAIQAFFAFYGHFGVQIFIFLSAYGLAKTHWDDSEPWTSFMWDRIKKLYPMFVLAILFWAALAAIQIGPVALISHSGLEIMCMLAGFSTLVPGMGLPPIGPWWFIPFIMQFYVLWPLLRKLTQKLGWPALVVLSISCYFVAHYANPVLAHWSISLAMTPIGRMRVICLGIIAARFPIRFNAFLAIPAFAVMILGSRFQEWSHFTSLASVVLSLWLYHQLRPLLRRFRTLEQIGNYSLAIFLINGIVRVPFLWFARSPLSQIALGCASAVVTLAISAFFFYLLEQISRVSIVPVEVPVAWRQTNSANAGRINSGA